MNKAPPAPFALPTLKGEIENYFIFGLNIKFRGI